MVRFSRLRCYIIVLPCTCSYTFMYMFVQCSLTYVPVRTCNYLILIIKAKILSYFCFKKGRRIIVRKQARFRKDEKTLPKRVTQVVMGDCRYMQTSFGVYKLQRRFNTRSFEVRNRFFKSILPTYYCSGIQGIKKASNLTPFPRHGCGCFRRDQKTL